MNSRTGRLTLSAAPPHVTGNPSCSAAASPLASDAAGENRNTGGVLFTAQLGRLQEADEGVQRV